MTKRILAILCGLFLLAQGAIGATLLPPGEIQFFDNNGQPLSGGLVYFYIPNTSTPKDTYRDPGQTQLNSNPVVLDSAGRAIIYGAGTYREQLRDALGNLIWDQLTADTSANSFSWAGTSGGTANAQTLTAPNFTNGDGQTIGFVAGFTNTGALTLSVNGGTPITVLKATGAGPASLVGGEVVAGNQYEVSYSAGSGDFQLVSYPITPGFGQSTNIASATTTDLGTIISHFANVTGSTAINSFGASANISQPLYVVTFSGSLTLTYNGTSLILPGGSSILTQAGDSLTAQYLGSGNWKVLSYSRASGIALNAPTGQARLNFTNSTTVTLLPVNGDQITIAGQSYPIPSAGVTGAVGSLTPSTLYYVYAFVNSGSIALEFDTTGHATDTTPGNVGVQIESGNNSRSLVGMVYPQSGPVFASNLVSSWFNRQSIGITTHFTTARSVSSSSFAEIDAEIECDFLTWAGEAVTGAANGTVENSGGSGATLSTTIAFDSTTVPSDAYTQATITGSGTPASGMGMSIAQSGLSEGFHFATLLGAASTSTATWPGSSSPGSRTTLNIGVRG